MADSIEDGRGAIVGGRPGMGRSRLAEESVRLLRERDYNVLQLWGIEGLADRPLAALSLSLDQLDAPARVDDDPRAVWRQLVGMASQRPLGVVVDDAHHLDPVSAEILLLLARQRHAVVIATVRSHHPLPGPIGGLRKDLGAMRLDLLPLGRRETATLARHALGAEVDGDLLQELWRLVRGNPLYLRELLSDRTTLDSIVPDGDVVRLRRPLMVTAGLDDVVQMRLAGLSLGARQVLEILALGPLTLEQLLRLVDPADLAIVERDGLVMVPADAGQVVRIALPLHAEVLRAGLPRAARTAMLQLIQRDDSPSQPRSSTQALLLDSDRLLHTQPHRAERLARSAHEHAPQRATAVAVANALASGGQVEAADRFLAGCGLADSEAERVWLRSALTGDGDDPVVTALRSGDPASALVLLDGELGGPAWRTPARRRWSIESRLWLEGPDAVAEEVVAWFHASLGHSMMERGHAALALGTVSYWQGDHQVASARLSEAARLLAEACAEGHGQAVTMRAWMAADAGGEGSASGANIESIGDGWWAGICATNQEPTPAPVDPLAGLLVTHRRATAGLLVCPPQEPSRVMKGKLAEALRVVSDARTSGRRQAGREALRMLPTSLHWLLQRAPMPAASAPAVPRRAAPSLRQPGLTGREREVATLAAAGMSDVEIAGRLVVSPRTVQTHLARAYRKLEVSGRRSLASALSRTADASQSP